MGKERKRTETRNSAPVLRKMTAPSDTVLGTPGTRQLIQRQLVLQGEGTDLFRRISAGSPTSSASPTLQELYKPRVVT
jgi:hypothetical protein